MHSNSLRLSPRASASVGLLLVAGVYAQSTVSLPGQTAPSVPSAAPGAKGASPATGAPNPKALEGVPEFLLIVPNGNVEMGLTSDALLNAAAQVISPMKPLPEAAAKMAPEQLKTALERTARALGRRKVEVPAFLLAKWPVKCAEYEAYIQQRLQQGVKIRPPYHWWRYGREDHYLESLPQIKKEFPKDGELAPVMYWERHGLELPYQLKDSDGKSIADLPVTYVDYRQANEFAAWYGMRLPTEAEYTRAVRGDGTNVWPWGKSACGDAWSEDVLKHLGLFSSSERRLKPVGTVPGCTGPFGHLDMFGQVWHFVSGLNYGPINGPDLFSTEWKALQKDKIGKMAQSPPAWMDNHVIIKGGSYMSTSEPISFLIDARVKVQPIEVVPGVGFRLAKSLQPGYDLLFSLLRGSFNRGHFEIDQDVDLSRQIGAEHYTMAANGFPDAYHAVSFAPVEWLTNDKNSDLAKLFEKSQSSPVLVGAFATTMPLLEPKAPTGLYSVLFRKSGTPKDLQEAFRAGQKRSREEPEPEDGGGAKKSEGDEKPKAKDAKRGWREVLTKYGITEQDLDEKSAENGPTFVRIGGAQVPLDQDCYLLHDNQGQIAAVIPVQQGEKPAMANPFASELNFAANADSKAIARFHVGAPLLAKNNKKVVDFRFQVTVDRAANAPWRLPLP